MSNTTTPRSSIAEQRNPYVAELARVAFVAHATPGGQIERLVGELAAVGKPLLTFTSEYNAGIIAPGTQGVSASSAVNEIRAALG